jgi:hypothetical protein
VVRGVARAFDRLRGSSIVSWIGVEMAFREVGVKPAQFKDAAVPLRQFSRLEMVLRDGRRHRVSTYQNDTAFGLLVQEIADADDDLRRHAWDAIYRTQEPSDLPTGLIDQLTPVMEDGELEEVLLSIEAEPLLAPRGRSVGRARWTAVLLPLRRVHPCFH